MEIQINIPEPLAEFVNDTASLISQSPQNAILALLQSQSSLGMSHDDRVIISVESMREVVTMKERVAQ